ncbi:MAG: hypothetical protein N2C12_16290 [Planctomycetales bacterium]
MEAFSDGNPDSKDGNQGQHTTGRSAYQPNCPVAADHDFSASPVKWHYQGGSPVVWLVAESWFAR